MYVVNSTAHPAKFRETVEMAVQQVSDDIEFENYMPEDLRKVLHLPKRCIQCPYPGNSTESVNFIKELITKSPKA